MYKIKRNVYIALFVALSVVFHTLRVPGFTIKGLPIILSGFVVGPIGGFMTGAIADIVGFIIRPSKFPFNPIFTFTAGLAGFMPVFIASLLNGRSRKNFKFWHIFFGILIGKTLTTIIIVPYFLHILYKINYMQKVISTATRNIYVVPGYSIVVSSVFKILERKFKDIPLLEENFKDNNFN